MIYLITRHPGAAEWLIMKGYEGVVQPHLERAQIQRGNLYIGVLPIPMVKEILDAGSRFFLLVLPDIAFGQRGQEMTPVEMEKAGACLVEVTRIDLTPVDLAGGHQTPEREGYREKRRRSEEIGEESLPPTSENVE